MQILKISKRLSLPPTSKGSFLPSTMQINVINYTESMAG